MIPLSQRQLFFVTAAAAKENIMKLNKKKNFHFCTHEWCVDAEKIFFFLVLRTSTFGTQFSSSPNNANPNDTNRLKKRKRKKIYKKKTFQRK